MKLKPIPNDQSFEGLFLPNTDHDYFAGASEHPFERATEFSPVDAWWLAELSLLSYVSDLDFIENAVAAYGEVKLFEREGAACLVVGDTVAFRGTDDGQDVLRNLDVRLTEEGAGQVHRGFRDALELLWSDVALYLGDRAVWFTGHSQGAALAVIAASRTWNAQAVYTFGSPRIGDKAFADGVDVPVFRIVNNNDLVTRMPPPIVYEHFGELMYIDDSGTLQSGPDLWERVKEQIAGHGTRIRENVTRLLDGDFSAIPYDSLVDHSPLHYTIHMWNNVVAKARK